MTLVFCMKKKLSYLTFLKVMYVKKGINFRHDINSVEMNTANIYCRRCKYQLCITYNLFLLTLKVVWCNLNYEQKKPFGNDMWKKSKKIIEFCLTHFSVCRLTYTQRARKYKKVQAKKLVKSNISKNIFREVAFLAVLNFSPVQK